MRRNLNSAQNIHWTILTLYIPWSHFPLRFCNFFGFADFLVLPIFFFFCQIFGFVNFFDFVIFCVFSIFCGFAIFSEHMEQFKQLIFPSSYKLVLIWVVLVFESNTPNYGENTKTLPKMLYVQLHVWLYGVQVMIYYISQNLKGGKLQNKSETNF